ncbi:hypothetical protein HHL21_09850 [Massilia sp. RP-1-19]|uniref:Uncharacterized protein n=1 Tax=Massilia polaris TaxID=2728846 RepID=A0A848HJH8_9BURK|nr:hypothetical protein [Massilia polaris]NML61374.1 hypothetical protein [Massilia polaris]
MSELQLNGAGFRHKTALAFVAAAHLLAIFAFTAVKPRPEKDAVWSDPVLLILPPIAEAVRPPALTRSPRPTTRERIRTPTREAVHAEQHTARANDLEIAADVPDVLIVGEPAPAVDLTHQAKRDLVKVERELAKTQRAGINGPPTYQSALAKGIEAAYKPRGITIKEYILPDGRRMSRVTGSGGSKCHAALDNHTIMAEAYRSQGRVAKEVPCPPN